jgi:hypothetical protein
MLNRPIAWVHLFSIGRNGIDVGSIGGKRKLCPLASSRSNYAIQQLIDSVDAIKGLDGVQGV